MNKRMLWLSAAACAAVVLAGCMTPMGGEMRTQGHKRFNDQVCNANATNCLIEVRIDCDPQPCVGVVDPKVLLIQKGTIIRELQPAELRQADVLNEFVGVAADTAPPAAGAPRRG